MTEPITQETLARFNAQHGADLTRRDVMPRVRTALDLAADLHAIRAGGLQKGDSTGWPSLDPHYTVVPGQWTLVTGFPGSGKSEFVDALMVNLAKRSGWRFAVYSPENYPQALHVAKLMEKITGKPFYPGPTEPMTDAELAEASCWLDERFGFIESQEQANRIDNILAECFTWLMFHKGEKCGIVVDPWNELEHQRDRHYSVTEYVSDTLSRVRRFARIHGVHIWIVAHPQKLSRDRDGKRPVPTPSDVSDSAHWWNKADNAICVHRDQVEGGQMVQVHVQKVRFKHVGCPGLVDLRYDRVTGRYHEPALYAAREYARASRGED